MREDIVVGMVTTSQTGRSGFESRQQQHFIFSSPKGLDRLCGPPDLLFNEYRGTFAAVKRPGREVNHSPLMARIRMDGAIPLLPLYAFKA